MDKNVLVLFAKYNKTVNELMNAIIKTLNQNEWNKELGGYFKSVQGLCSHLYICDFNWLKRYSKLRDFSVFKEALFNRELYSFKEVLFDNMNEYFEKRSLLDEKIISFIDEINDNDIKSNLKYTDSHGTPYELNFAGLIMQSFNHDTFHRGMISLYLEMLGKENDYSSFGVVL
jgi:uncharacterized damage-inducible protein DinB